MCQRRRNGRVRTLGMEPLEDRRLLATVTVGNLNDLVNGATTSIAALIANDGGDGISLREAVLAANADNTDADNTIEFGSLTGTISLTDVDHAGEIVISSNLTIKGPGADVLALQAFAGTAAAGDGARIFNIDDGMANVVRNVSLSGLKLFGGDAAGAGGAIFARENLTVAESIITGNSTLSVSTAGGGGIYSAPASFTTTFPNSLSIINCSITGNEALRAEGGGIRKRTGNLVIEGSTISENTSNVGGGVSVADNVMAVQIADSTFSNNAATAGGGGGGGLFIYDVDSLSIADSQISFNSTAGSGGGVYQAFVTVASITGCTINDNSAAGAGGGIRSAFTQLTVASTSITRNAATGPSARGGGIYSQGGTANLAVTDSEVSHNTAGRNGGGVFHDSPGPLSITGSSIAGNSASGAGGGVSSTNATIAGSSIRGNTAAAGGGIHISGALTVSETTMSGNSAGVGAGVFSRLSSANTFAVTSSTISGNAASGNGGGMYLFAVDSGATFSVRQSTVASNVASGFGGGIEVVGGTLMLANSIVASDAPSAALAPDLAPLFGAVIDAKFSLIGSNSGTTLAEAPLGSPDANGNLIGGPVDGAIAPLLAPLANNLGPLLVDGSRVQTHVPLPGSPAIDAGDPTALAGVDGVPEFDQRGNPFQRVVDGDGAVGARIDIGAVETQLLAVNLIVDTLVDESDDDYSPGDLSLREAVELLPFAMNKTITFAPALAGGSIVLTHGHLAIHAAANIVGPGAELLTIDASGNDPTPTQDNGDGTRVFSIPPGFFIGGVAISGLTLSGGDTTMHGGAIASYSGNLVLADCTITGNSAIGKGGGVFGQELTVINSIISGNMGRSGGGGLHGVIVTVTDSTISDNYATRDGGGLYGTSVTVTNSTVDGNTAEDQGGGLWGADVTVTGSTISDNFASRDGGGIFGANISVTGSTISGNRATSSGGGIYADGPMSVKHSTITGNRVSGGGGGIQSNGAATLLHTIVAGNTRGASSPNDFRGNITLSFSLLGANLGASVTDQGGNLIGTQVAPLNPKLAPLADNGGPTMTHALLPDSLAIDAGDPAAVAGVGGVPLFDQRGLAFSRVAGGRIDMGAFESGAVSADFDGDLKVDGSDFLVWQRGLGATGVAATRANGNADGDADVDEGDLAAWKSQFGLSSAVVGAAVIPSSSLASEDPPSPVLRTDDRVRSGDFGSPVLLGPVPLKGREPEGSMQSAVDAVFAAGDFSQLFVEHGDAPRRKWQPPRRVG